MYRIEVIETKKNKIPQIKAAKDGVLLKHPFSLFVVGKTGSGKSMAILNMLSKDWGYKDYFDKIIVFSPTAGVCDDNFDGIVPEDNILNNFDPEFIDMIFESQKKQLEKKKDIHKIPRILLWFDDLQGIRTLDKQLTKVFVKNRHYSISCIYSAQSFKNSLPRSARLQASGVILFPASNSETDTFNSEFCPNFLSKKEFSKLIDYCHSEPYNFLFVNNQVKMEDKYRHNFDTKLALTK